MQEKTWQLHRYTPHYRANLKLAYPVMLAQAGQMVVVLADNLMVGHLGAVPLAAASFANTIFVVGMVFGIGMVNGLTPLVGKAYGSRNYNEAALWLRQGFYSFQAAGLILVLLLLGVSLFMHSMGQPPGVVELAIPYYLILVFSMIPFVLFFTFKQFAEGLGNTRIAMIITVASNVVNIALNYIWIFGKLGFPPMGLMGAGYATLVARLLMPLIFLWVYFRLRFFRPYRLLLKETQFSYKLSFKLMRLGLPIGGQYLIEVLAFSLGSIMMGWIGATALAAHQIVLSLASFTFMVSSGLSAATTVKVSHFIGQNQVQKLRTTAFASLHLVLLIMFASGITFVALRHVIPSLFISDPAVITIAAGLMFIAGAFQIFDGLQVVMLGALRGLEDVKLPFIMLVVAYFILALPAGWFLTFHLNMGPQGIWIGYLTGLISIATFLLLRFRWMTKKEGASPSPSKGGEQKKPLISTCKLRNQK